MSPSGPPVELLARLGLEQVVWLTTLRPDGSPHVTPVWFVLLGGGAGGTGAAATWWVATGATNVKVTNLRHDPRVALALTLDQRPVVAEGRAELHADTFPAAVVRAFADKYDGWDVEQREPDGAPRLLVQIPVTRWLLQGSAR